MNGKLKRKWTTTKGLEKQIDLYFSENNNECGSIEMLYVHIGVTKFNVYDWGRHDNPTHKEWYELIKTAKEFIHSYLTHNTMNTTDNPKPKLLYLKNRFKDDGEGDIEKQEKVVININNEGTNSLIGGTDA